MSRLAPRPLDRAGRRRASGSTDRHGLGGGVRGLVSADRQPPGGLGILASATMTLDELQTRGQQGSRPRRTSRSASTSAPTQATRNDPASIS